MKVDETQILKGTFSDVDGFSLPLLLSQAEVDALLTEYDSTQILSPSEDTSREIARAILDALKKNYDES